MDMLTAVGVFAVSCQQNFRIFRMAAGSYGSLVRTCVGASQVSGVCSD